MATTAQLPPYGSPKSSFTASMQSFGELNNESPTSKPPLASGLPINMVLKDSSSRQLILIGGAMIAAVIMSFILLLGSVRKRTSNGFFKGLLWLIVTSTPMVIYYCLGNMTKTDDSRIGEDYLFLVWGTILLHGLASYGTISAFKLEDNENAWVTYFQGYLKQFFFLFMIFGFIESQLPTYLWWLLFFLVLALLARLQDRPMSMSYASKTNLTNGVGAKVKIIDDYMVWDAQKRLKAEEEQVSDDPMTMDGYRYLVGIKHLMVKQPYEYSPPFYRIDFEKENIITTQEIWQCEGKLLSSTGGDPDGRLKDTCLSFALFWTLLRRYVGYPLAEMNLLEQKAWNFVHYGLIPEITSNTCERAFRVIEQELSFVYDYFYSKNFITYMYGIRIIIWRVLTTVLFVLIAIFILKDKQEILVVVISENLPPIKVGIIITRVVIFAMVFFDVVLMVHYFFITQWARVDWLCFYVQKQLWRRQSWKDVCLRWTIEHICNISLRKTHKNWKREIGQYCLITSQNYISRLHRYMCIVQCFIPPDFLDRQVMGRKASEPIPFSTNLKKAILLSLHTNGRQLSNGKSSLRKYGLETDFLWDCNLETHTQTILVWHIATTFCELSYLNLHPGTLIPESLLVATSLSKYCAYLVAFAPKLLPDQPNIALDITENVILEATKMFSGCCNNDAKYERMKGMTEECQEVENPIMKKGIWLGKSLTDKMSSEPSWEMLGEFWAELLLYLAPSDNVSVHIQYLADGGELITHLWTLLTHAGILKRD